MYIYISIKFHNHAQFPFLQIPIHHIRCFLFLVYMSLSFSTPPRKHKPRPKPRRFQNHDGGIGLAQTSSWCH